MIIFFKCGLMGYEWDVSPLIGLTSFIYPMIWGFNVDLMGSHEHRKLLYFQAIFMGIYEGTDDLDEKQWKWPHVSFRHWNDAEWKGIHPHSWPHNSSYASSQIGWENRYPVVNGGRAVGLSIYRKWEASGS